jgi:hypothetical protein
MNSLIIACLPVYKYSQAKSLFRTSLFLFALPRNRTVPGMDWSNDIILNCPNCAGWQGVPNMWRYADSNADRGRRPPDSNSRRYTLHANICIGISSTTVSPECFVTWTDVYKKWVYSEKIGVKHFAYKLIKEGIWRMHWRNYVLDQPSIAMWMKNKL